MAKKLTEYVPSRADKEVFKAGACRAGNQLAKALGTFLNHCGSHGIPAHIAAPACAQWVLASLSRVMLVVSDVPMEDVSDQAIADLSLDLQEQMADATFEMMLKVARDKENRN
jgi:long-subunit acyl-CoA synthetase (AMP-forming)